MLNSVYTKIFYNLQRWKAVYTLLFIFVPALLTAQKGNINPQTQQLLNKTSKSQFFIENKGQWPKQVKFLARLGGMNAWITDSGVVYDYFRINRNYSPDSLLRMPRYEKDEFERTHTTCKGQVVRMDYEGINLNAEKQGINKKEAYYNYFIGNDSTEWASFVGLYGEVLVKDAFNGIDIRYYFDCGQIRYDYLVKPGACISKINFSLSGADALAVNESGELIIKTNLGEVKHGKLYAYQQYDDEKKEVSCRFERNEDGNFRVIASNYEKGLALVIDPLVWSTFIGGTNSEWSYSLAIDRLKNVYITGSTESQYYPTTSGAYDTVISGSYPDGDIFITKFNASASILLFSTFIGGSDSETGTSIKLDTIDNVYITGSTSSNNFPTTLNAFDKTFNDDAPFASAGDCFILKMNSIGSALIYSTYIGGKEVEGADFIAIDNLGCAYISGSSRSIEFPTTTGAFKTSHPSMEYDAFVTKINPTGTALVYSTLIGPNDSYYGTSMVLDKNHNIYITGQTCSSIFTFPTTMGAYDQTFNGACDVFITKLNSTGSALIFSTLIGGSDDDYSRSIALDSYGNVIITGNSWSNNYPTTTGAYNTKLHTNIKEDVFISKLDSSGSNLLASTFLGGYEYEYPYSIASDIEGNIYVTGWTNSSDFPTTSDALNQSNSGAYDVFISKLNPDLSYLMYSTYFGGSGSDIGYFIYVAPDKKVYITGTTHSANFPTTSGAYDQNYNGDIDVFLSEISIINQASNIIYTNIDCSQMRISWKKGEGEKRLVFIKEGTSGFPIPINNTTYNANTIFGSGYQIGSTGWYCIYNDTGATEIIRGLKSKTNYRIMVIEYTGTPGNEKYVTIPAFNNPINQVSGKPPVASFSIIDSVKCKGENFLFIDKSTSTPEIISYVWWFGDGDSSSLQNTTHSFKSSGSYSVKLIVSGGIDCEDSIIQSVNVLLSPIASFSINDNTQCLDGNNFSFSNKSSFKVGNFSSNWQFGDGKSSVIDNPLHSFAYSDTFLVKLIVISDSGCKDSVINKVTVSKPNAKFISYDSSQCLERNNFAFTNKSTSANGSFSCLWNFGDSLTSTLFNPMHAYNYANTFTVILIVTDTIGCKDTFSKHTWVHVHPEPLADFTINDSSQCLSGNIFIQSNNSTLKSGTFSQKWEFDDGYDTNAFNSSHSYKLANNYLIKLLIVSDWGCKDSILKKVYVRPMPVAGFGINVNPQYLTINNYIFTNKSSLTSGTMNYYWNFGDGDTSSHADPAHIYQTVDTFDVKLLVVSDYGCRDSITQKVWLLYPPMQVDFLVKNVCLGDIAWFQNTSTVQYDSFRNFLWDFGDGSPAIKLKDPGHLYYDTGLYQVQMVALTYRGFKDTTSHSIRILPSPTVKITADPDTIVEEGVTVKLTANGVFDSIFWNTGKSTASIEVDKTGSYSLRVIAFNGCDASDSIMIRYIPKTPFSAMNVITPNGDGINDLWKINNIDKYQPCKLIIYSRWCDEIYSTSNYQNNWDGIYKGKSLPEGTYYFILVAKDGKAYKGAVNILRN